MTIAIAGLALAAALAGEAWPHAAERAFVLLLPTGYYLLGGSLAVAATFLALRFAPAGAIERLFRARLGPVSFLALSALPFSLASLFLTMLLLLAGWLGSRDPLVNPLPTTFWTLGWIGFALAHAFLGNLWGFFNPLLGADWLIGKALARMGARTRPLALYPAWLGYWPAILGFFGFAWFELVFPAPEDPDLLADAILFYLLVNLAAMRLFGADSWLEKAEAFSVFFRLLSGLAPILVEREGSGSGRATLTLVFPGATLIAKAPARADFALFVLLALASVSFDGLARTFWWLDLAGVNPLEFPGRTAMVGWNSAGLLAVFGLLVLLYGAAEAMGRRLGGIASAGWPFRAVVSLVPISLGFHAAHYLTAFLVNGQYAKLALSDPFDRGWDLLGLGSARVTTSFLNNQDDVTLIWNAQAAAIVLGHILAVLMAQGLAAPTPSENAASWMGQAPLAALMVFYTLFGLWLLSTPVGA